MNWRPSAEPLVLEHRAAMLTAARQFFAERSILEVQTPTLHSRGVTDPMLSNIECRLNQHPGRLFYLQTSPEYFMKRLLASGSRDIYQIGPVFRDDEAGRAHQPEFTMIEWYRRGFDLDAMINETVALIECLALAVDRPLGPTRTFDFRDVFANLLNLDPLTAKAEQLRAAADCHITGGIDSALAAQLGNERDSWLDLLMSFCIMPILATQHPRSIVTVRDYPASQAALARLAPQDPAVAERFEIMVDGLELANGYRELLDADEFRSRIESHADTRRAAGLTSMQPDELLLAAMEHGLPDCAGVALGFDRLAMAVLELSDIAAARSFAIT